MARKIWKLIEWKGQRILGKTQEKGRTVFTWTQEKGERILGKTQGKRELR